MVGLMVELDAAVGAAKRDEAIQRAADNADPAWKARALLAIYWVALHHPYFLVDQVWALLGDDRPREPRAMGDRMNTARRLGWIESVAKDTTRQTSRNRGLCTGWNSNIYRCALPVDHKGKGPCQPC